MDIEKSPPIFPALTGIRTIAVYLVYLHHTNPFTTEWFGNFIPHFVNEFHIGVSIFFVLSGFLITLRYYESATLRSTWLKKYFQNRIARVYPMYFILTTLTLIVTFFQYQGEQNALFTYLMNITFLKGFFDDLKFTLIGQGWSLTVEECFYIAAPLLFLGIRKSNWFILFFTVVSILVGCLLVVVFSEVNFYGFFKSYYFLFTYTFPGRCAELLMGASIVILFHDQLKEEKKGILFTFLGAGLLVCVVIIMTLLDSAYLNLEFGLEKIAVTNFLLPLTIALLFYGLITESSWLKKLLSTTLFVTLGKASYTFYLIHVGVVYSLINHYLPNDFLLTFLIINLISLGLWYSLEEPLNRLIRNI